MLIKKKNISWEWWLFKHITIWAVGATIGPILVTEYCPSDARILAYVTYVLGLESRSIVIWPVLWEPYLPESLKEHTIKTLTVLVGSWIWFWDYGPGGKWDWDRSKSVDASVVPPTDADGMMDICPGSLWDLLFGYLDIFKLIKWLCSGGGW